MKQLFLYFIVFSSINVLGQNVYIPDVNFKNYLLSHAGINSNLDTAIQVSEANTFNGSLFIENMNISDLTGIEAFINLNVLHCYNNQLTTLDVSNNTGLYELNCSYNQISSLDVSNNSKIKTLISSYNQLTNIDLTSVDSLTSLYVENNSLSAINLNNNLNLYLLRISNNNISSINLSNNILLNTLKLEKTLVSSLDLSNNSNLQLVFLDSNINLYSLNLKNGNNLLILPSTTTPNFLGNPNLTCIQVDDSAYSTNNWTNIDPQHFFSENCATSVKELDQNQWLTVFPNPAKTKITININNEALSKKLTLKLISLEGKNILQKHLNSTVNTFDINHLPAGFYTLSLHNNGSIFANKKIIISH